MFACLMEVGAHAMLIFLALLGAVNTVGHLFATNSIGAELRLDSL